MAPALVRMVTSSGEGDWKSLNFFVPGENCIFAFLSSSSSKISVIKAGSGLFLGVSETLHVLDLSSDVSFVVFSKI